MRMPPATGVVHGPRDQTDPSGPNSVPDLMRAKNHGSGPCGRTDESSLAISPNNRRSTSELSCTRTFAV